MKLRIARKIYKRIDTPDESRYSQFQRTRAVDRVERTASHKALERWWRGVVRDTYDAAANGCPAAIRLLEECRRRNAELIGPVTCARCPNPIGKDDEGWPSKDGPVCTECWEKESAEAWHEFVSVVPQEPRP